MKLLLDENLSPAHARTLRELGYDAVAVVEMGLSGAEDAILRVVAIEQGRVLDGDFANVLRYPPAETPGVLRLRLHPPTDVAIDKTLRWALTLLAGQSVEGKLVVVDEKRIRIRG